MLTYFTKTFDQPFVLAESQLHEVIDLLSGHFDNIDLVAPCADEGTRSFDSLEELLSYRNNPSHRILALKIEADARSLEDRKYLRLQWLRTPDNTFSETSLTISAEDKIVTELRAHVETIISSTRPSKWYIRMANLKESDVLRFLANILLILSVTIGAMYMYSTFINPFLPSNPTTPITWKDINILIYSISFIFLVGYLFMLLLHHAIFKPKRALFPPGIFLIQDEIKQTEQLEKRRYLVLGTTLTIIITAIGTVVAIVLT